MAYSASDRRNCVLFQVLFFQEMTYLTLLEYSKLIECHDCTYTRLPHASTAFTSSHASTALMPPSLHAITGLHMYPRSPECGPNIILAHNNAWSHFGQHSRERVVARDVCFLVYKFHSRVSYVLSFQLCSLFTYKLAS